MRCSELFETTSLVRVVPVLIKQVLRNAHRIASDIAADLPPDLTETIEDLLARIDAICGIGPLMTVFRAELRARDEIMNISSTGVHWCWHADSAQVYHHDNAYDDAEREGYTRDQLVEITLEADVAFRSIDWPYTIATNLIHPAEREITVRSGQDINILGIYTRDDEIRFERTIPTTGSYP